MPEDSLPLTWGISGEICKEKAAAWFTPTCVGNMSSPRILALNKEAHSHLRRGYHRLNGLFKMLKDLLPLTWETSSRPDRWKPYGRLTLTNVRNIKNTSIFLQVRKTNPYKHREYCRSTSKLKNIHRITPTYVGNISLIWGMLLLMRTHPYLRREYLVLFLASVEPRDSPPLK